MKGTIVTGQVLRLLFRGSKIRCNLICLHCRGRVYAAGYSCVAEEAFFAYVSPETAR